MEKTTGIAEGPAAADVREGAVLEVVPRPTRTAHGAAEPRATVALFPTCLVEYQDPAIGQAWSSVYERNGIACDLPEGQVCCGMPWLDAGDVDKFEEHAHDERRPCSPSGARRARRSWCPSRRARTC